MCKAALATLPRVRSTPARPSPSLLLPPRRTCPPALAPHPRGSGTGDSTRPASWPFATGAWCQPALHRGTALRPLPPCFSHVRFSYRVNSHPASLVARLLALAPSPPAFTGRLSLCVSPSCSLSAAFLCQLSDLFTSVRMSPVRVLPRSVFLRHTFHFI